MTATSTDFSVTLHHFAPDGARAAADLPDVELPAVSAEQLRALLRGLAQLAPTIQYPAAPELRIAAADGRFLVQVKDGRIRFTSWSLRAGGSELTPEEIFRAITGEELNDFGPGGARETKSRLPKGVKIALLALAILGTNAITAWVLTRPPADALPEYRRLDPEPAQRMWAEVAGTYETGAEEGDRRLTIKTGGDVNWSKYAADLTLDEQTTLKAEAVLLAGRPALLTSTRAPIEVKDALTVIFYGDTYRRTTK